MSTDASITNAARANLRAGTVGRAFPANAASQASLQVSGWKKLPSDKVRFSGETGEDQADLSATRLRALHDSFGLDDLGDEGESQKAEEHEENATVAVFDDFRNADEKGQFTHGELVEGRLQEQGRLGDEDVQRYQTDLGADFGEFEENLARGEEGALERFIESSYTNSLDSTTGALEEVLDDDDSKIRTINQSQSQARGRLARDIWERTGDAPFREDLARSLGLESGVDDRVLAGALTEKINHTVSGSDEIAKAKNRYDQTSQEAAEAGLTHVVTSGNLGDFARHWEELGVQVDDDFYDSALINDNTIVAAAVDQSKAPPSSAGFNSPRAGADLAAPGVNLDVTAQDGDWTTASGTSLAAPAISAVAARLVALRPELSPTQIEEVLKETAAPARGPASDIGAGSLNPEEALHSVQHEFRANS